MSGPILTLPESTGIAGVAALRTALFELVDGVAGSPVELDCSAVRSIDAASMQCLLVARRKAASAGGTLVLARPSEDFRRCVAYVGLGAELLA